MKKITKLIMLLTFICISDNILAQAVPCPTTFYNGISSGCSVEISWTYYYQGNPCTGTGATGTQIIAAYSNFNIPCTTGCNPDDLVVSVIDIGGTAVTPVPLSLFASPPRALTGCNAGPPCCDNGTQISYDNLCTCWGVR